MKFFLLSWCVILAPNTFAQVGDTIYLDNNRSEVKSKQDARYYRVITSYNAATDKFYVVEYYLSGKKSYEADTRTVNGDVADGNYLYYFANGALRIKGKNKNSFGKDYENEEELRYPNGALQGNTSSKNFDYKIHHLYDSLGKQEVKNGNGRATFISYRDSMIEQGQVTDGLREGRWLVHDFNGDLVAKENYKNGRLTKGYRIRDQTDSTLYKDYGRGDNEAIIKDSSGKSRSRSKHRSQKSWA